MGGNWGCEGFSLAAVGTEVKQGGAGDSQEAATTSGERGKDVYPEGSMDLHWETVTSGDARKVGCSHLNGQGSPGPCVPVLSRAKSPCPALELSLSRKPYVPWGTGKQNGCWEWKLWQSLGGCQHWSLAVARASDAE